MKIAVFSDIHGNIEVLKTILEDIKKENINRIICLGDVIAIGPNSKECLDLIIDNNVELLLGNHELYYLYGCHIDPNMTKGENKHQAWVKSLLNEKHRDFLMNCKIEDKILFDNKTIILTHFLIEDINKPYPFYGLVEYKDNLCKTKYDYTIIGHEHKSFVYEKENKKVICLGSSGCVKSNLTKYTILDLTNDLKIINKELEFDRIKFEEIFNNINYPEKDFVGKVFFGIE